MAVCHVVYSRFPSDPRVRKEVQSLSDAGFDVSVICAKGTGESQHEFIGRIRVHRLPLPVVRGGRIRYFYQYSLFFLLTFAALFGLTLTKRFRIVHVHSLPDFLVFAALPLRFLGTRVILDLHESAPELFLARFPSSRGGLLDRLVHMGQRWSSRVADWIITVNPEIARLLEERGCLRFGVTVIENAPDWESEPLGGSHPSLLNGPNLVIACGLNPERDLELVLEACEIVSKRHDLRVMFVGEGQPSYIARLRAFANAHGMSDSVAIEPPVPHGRVRELLLGSTFGIVSYQRSPITEVATPNKAYEYGFLGIPMIVADLPALRTLLGDSVLYYRPGDGGDLAKSMLRLIEDGTLRANLSKQVMHVMAGHTWREMTTRLLSTYQDM